jgi:hypothetical protein
VDSRADAFGGDETKVKFVFLVDLFRVVVLRTNMTRGWCGSLPAE